MLIRIVKLKIKQQNLEAFLAAYKSRNPVENKINGCVSVKLTKVTTNSDLAYHEFCTISEWKSEIDLENYRNSPYFKETWTNLKPFFAQKAEAWSLTEI